jgi:hypothetical protein
MHVQREMVCACDVFVSQELEKRKYIDVLIKHVDYA